MSLRLPSWLQAGSHPAEDDRLSQGALWTPDGANDLTVLTGVAPGKSASRLLVAAQSTPDMTVKVNAGSAVIQGTNSLLQGVYTVTLDATTNVTIPAADPTNPRIDLICITVEDAFYSGTNNDAILQCVTGSPAASPSPPATPANSIVLAQVAVAANASSITSGNITDKRTFSVARGGVLPAKSTALPSNPYKGMMVYETDNLVPVIYNGSAWKPLAQTIFVRKASDTSRASNTTLANDPELQFSAVANATYIVDCGLIYDSADFTADIKVGFQIPSGATLDFYGHGPHNTDLTAGTNSNAEWVGRYGATSGTNIPWGSSTSAVGATLRACVVTSSTAGLIALEWAQNTSGTGAIVMKAGSWLEARRVA